MFRNGLILPVAALLIALLIGAALTLDFRQRWIVQQREQASVATPTLDGSVATDEYRQSVADESTGMKLHWTIAGDEIFFAIEVPNQGWVSVGIGGEGPMMQGADFLMAYVDDEGVHVEDHFGTGPTSHVADVEEGGSEDLQESAGSEHDGTTVIELKRALDTGDPNDQPITSQETRVLFAHAGSDDFTAYHAARSTQHVQFVLGESP